MLLGRRSNGFTLVEIAIVLLIMTVIFGYAVALLPRQQELKDYARVDRQMDEILQAVVGFAQINGRLPCPAIPNSFGREDIHTGGNGCNYYAGFVPANTLGLNGRLNRDSLLLDPWQNPYRYYVTNANFDASTGDTRADFTAPGEMRDVGLVDSDGDGYIDLDGRFLICDAAGDPADSDCDGADEVIGRYTAAGPDYAGTPLVILSQGKNWNQTPSTDELANRGSNLTPVAINGPLTVQYLLKDITGGQTTFVYRTTGFADDFDDVIRWLSPNILFSKMIEAGQLP